MINAHQAWFRVQEESETELCLFVCCYCLQGGEPMSVQIDKRKTVKDLKDVLEEVRKGMG